MIIVLYLINYVLYFIILGYSIEQGIFFGFINMWNEMVNGMQLIEYDIKGFIIIFCFCLFIYKLIVSINK